MQTFDNLIIRRVFPGSDGRFVAASYDGWAYEYRFFIREDGGIKGKTAAETWVDLSGQTAGIIRNKVNRYLRLGQVETETADQD